jgi:hypothetical protein
MKATIKINMDNAAFDPNGIELASILRDIANQCESQEELGKGFTLRARDANGNIVGELKVN